MTEPQMPEMEIMMRILAKRNDHFLDSRNMLRLVGDQSCIYQRAEARWTVLDDLLQEIAEAGGLPHRPVRDELRGMS